VARTNSQQLQVAGVYNLKILRQAIFEVAVQICAVAKIDLREAIRGD
jgi:predicted GNAT family N-acyltransferase